MLTRTSKLYFPPGSSRATLAQKELRERSRKYIAKNSKNAQDHENALQPRPAGDQEPEGRGTGLARAQPLTPARGARGGTSFPRRRRASPAATRDACAWHRAETAPGEDSSPGARAVGAAARPARCSLAGAGTLREPGLAAPRSPRAAAAAGRAGTGHRAQPQPRPAAPGGRVPELRADVPSCVALGGLSAAAGYPPSLSMPS